MQLRFTINKPYDITMAYHMLCDRPGYLDRFALDAHDAIMEAVHARDQTRTVTLLTNALTPMYNHTLPYLQKTIPMYRASWREINDTFFHTVATITNAQWRNPLYTCVISPFQHGISSWGGDTIVRSWAENPYTMRSITAHELIISHIFSVCQEQYAQEQLRDHQIWVLAEIVAFALIGLDPRLHALWPWVAETERYPLNHNYPELYDLQKILRPIYEQQGFTAFLQEGIMRVKSITHSAQHNARSDT